MTEKQREKDMDALKTDIADLREHIESLAASVKSLRKKNPGGLPLQQSGKVRAERGAPWENNGIADGRIFSKNSKRRATAAKRPSRTLPLK